MSRPALAAALYRVHRRFRVSELNSQNCRHRFVSHELKKIVAGSGGRLSIEATGQSTEERIIPLVRFGSGPVSILLWSQMHGDEPTATLALMDIFRFLGSGGIRQISPDWIEERCSIYVIPMLNPDGAQRFSRVTAGMIDMNRDARRLRTPEAQFLRRIQKSIRPRFGFNLHDQELSTVGQSSRIAAIALLAPAADQAARMTPVRRRAVQVGATIARALGNLAPGRISSYDDAHEPRAFGDMMQAWGTSTVLVESGHWKGDHEKEKIRSLNFAGLLTAIHSISDGSYRRISVDHYHALPGNSKRAYDIIIRGVRVMNTDRSQRQSDVGLRTSWKKEKRTGVSVRVCEVGDLRHFSSILELPGGRRGVEPSHLTPGLILPLPFLARNLHISLPPNLL
ncbi:MAG: M14 family zinc carboxypeptidase [Ignavibacteria bacterium]|nr:M14 family zinc carboxypeptidase [Ignavibacteria bacterium]